VSHVNIVKKVKIGGEWKLLSIRRNTKGNYDWDALPDRLYLIEGAPAVRADDGGRTATRGLWQRRPALRAVFE
jgi:hypothetical protein